MSRLLLRSMCLFILQASVAAFGFSPATDFNELRNLQTQRGCGEVLGVITTDQVRAAGRKLLSNFLNDTKLLDRSVGIIFLPVEFNLTIVKLCASCKDHAVWYYEQGGLKFPGYHATYCVEGEASYEAEFSMLAFLLRDPTNFNKLPAKVSLRTFLTLPSTRADLNHQQRD